MELKLKNSLVKEKKRTKWEFATKIAENNKKLADDLPIVLIVAFLIYLLEDLEISTALSFLKSL